MDKFTIEAAASAACCAFFVGWVWKKSAKRSLQCDFQSAAEERKRAKRMTLGLVEWLLTTSDSSNQVEDTS